MEIVNGVEETIFLHHNIRCLRKRLNLSQEELAQRIGLNRGNIASYEKGSAEPKLCNLLKISNFFGVSMLDITKEDLRCDHAFANASNNFQQFSNSEKQFIDQFIIRAEELKTVLNSIYTCHQFKAKSLDELPKDMQIIIMNFEQLFEATQQLMRNHHALLDFIKCRIK